jgi:hypothetical protein
MAGEYTKLVILLPYILTSCRWFPSNGKANSQTLSTVIKTVLNIFSQLKITVYSFEINMYCTVALNPRTQEMCYEYIGNENV